MKFLEVEITPCFNLLSSYRVYWNDVVIWDSSSQFITNFEYYIPDYNLTRALTWLSCCEYFSSKIILYFPSPSLLVLLHSVHMIQGLLLTCRAPRNSRLRNRFLLPALNHRRDLFRKISWIVRAVCLAKTSWITYWAASSALLSHEGQVHPPWRRWLVYTEVYEDLFSECRLSVWR